MVITVYFSVSVPFPVLDKHFVFVTGSSIKLGNLKVNKALKLKKDKDDRWVGIIKLVGLPINYTYFIGYYIKSEKSTIKKDVAVFQWETSKPRSLLTSHVLANKRVKLYNVFGEEGDDIKYNFDQVLPGDSLELSIKKEIGGVKVVDLDLKKKSKTSSGTQLKKKDDIINEKNDQIKEKNRQIRTLRGRITQLEQDKNALKDDNKYLTQQNKYLTDCLLKSLPNNQQIPNNNYYGGGGRNSFSDNQRRQNMDNNYNNYGGGGGGSSFSNNQQRPNMNNNNYNNNGGGGGGFAQGQRAPNSGGNFYGNSMPQANPTISVYVSQNTQVGVPAFGNSNTAQDNRRYENDNDHWKTAFEKQQQFSQDLLQRIPYYTNPQHQQHNMGNNASVGRQRANVGNNSYEHVPQRNNGYDSVPQRTNVGGAGYGNPANEFVDPLYNNNVQQPSCSYGNQANGYEFTKQADFSYDNVPHNQNTQQPTVVTEY